MAVVSSSSAARTAAPNPTILLVDDDPFQANVHRLALERHFASIERVAGASEALIRVGEPGSQETLGLIVVDLRLPGVAGAAFVNELSARVPRMPILAIGRPGETASDYPGANIRFLPAGSLGNDVLATVRSVLSLRLRQVA